MVETLQRGADQHLDSDVEPGDEEIQDDEIQEAEATLYTRKYLSMRDILTSMIS